METENTLVLERDKKKIQEQLTLLKMRACSDWLNQYERAEARNQIRKIEKWKSIGKKWGVL